MPSSDPRGPGETHTFPGRSGSRALGVAAVVAINIVVLAGLLGALELGARVLVPRDIPVLFDDPLLQRTGMDFVEPNPARGFALVPGFHNDRITINSLGCRGPELPEHRENLFTILAIGESTTFGWRCSDDETLPHFLQLHLDRMRTDPPCLVVNGGVPSYTSAQVLDKLEELLPAVRPDAVLINIVWNDIWYSTVQPWYPELLVTQQPPAWRRFLLKRSGLYRAFAIRSEDRPSVVDVFNEAAFAHYLANVKKMIRACREAGAVPVIVDPQFDADHVEDGGIRPLQQGTYTREFLRDLIRKHSRALRQTAEHEDAVFVSHRFDSANPHYELLFSDCVHPTRGGNYLMAEDLARALVERGVIRRR